MRTRHVFNPFLFLFGLRFAAGADGGDGAGGGAGNGNGAGNAGDDKDPPRTFKQSELDAMFSSRAKQAASSAVSEVLTKLGVKDLDEAQTKLKKAAEAEAAQLTELDKTKKELASAQAAQAAAEQKAVEAAAKAEETLMQAAVVAEAAKQNFHDPQDCWLYVDRTKIKAKDGGAFDGVKEAVEAVAKAKAHLVKPQRQPIGTPPRQGANGKGGGQQQTEQPRKSRLNF